MKRREFIKLSSAGIPGIVLIPSLLNGCSSNNVQALDAWNVSPNENDIRLAVLSYAILAANPHNIQPWIVKFISFDTIELYVDQNRLLPKTDPFSRQIHIAQGTFLENLDLAAKQFGYQAMINYFPHGSYSNTTIEQIPVGSVKLAQNKTIPKDPLFDIITKRLTSKIIYDEKPVEPALIQDLLSIATSKDITLFISDQANDKKRIAEIIGNAMRIEVSKKERHLETWRMFRFSDQEIEQNRDGFGYANNGVAGITRFFAELIYDRAGAKPLDSYWVDSSIDLHYDWANSAAAFGWIISKGNSRTDQIKTGRLYERLNLKANQLGISKHPHSQVLEEYRDMQQQKNEFLDFLNVPKEFTVQMLFRLGFSDFSLHSPRRKLQDIVV